MAVVVLGGEDTEVDQTHRAVEPRVVRGTFGVTKVEADRIRT